MSEIISQVEAKMAKNLLIFCLLSNFCFVTSSLIEIQKARSPSLDATWGYFVGDVIRSQADFKNCFLHFYFDSTPKDEGKKTQALLQSLKKHSYG